MDDIAKMQEEMALLKARIESRNGQAERATRTKKAIFEGMSAEAAFDLGQQVGRGSA